MDPNQQQAPSAPAGEQAAAPTSWLDSLPEAQRSLAAERGWATQKPEEAFSKALDSYQNLHKYLGADKAGRGVILPDEKSSPDEIKAFHTRLGVPADPNGYELKLPDDFPDPDFVNVAAPLLHKHNIPKGAGQALIADFTASVKAAEAARIEAETKEFERQETQLKTDWGADFDRNVEIARRGMAKFGFTADVIDAIETKAGFASVIKAMHAAGLAVGEGKFIDDKDSGAKFGESLADLNAARSKLYNDPAWAQRYFANDATARNEAKAIEEKIALARSKLGA